MRAGLLFLLVLSAMMPAMAEPYKGSDQAAASSSGSSQTRKVAPVVLTPSSLSLSGTSATPLGPSIKCNLKVRKIGPLKLEDAHVVIADRVVEVHSDIESQGVDPLLKGSVLRLDEKGTADGVNRIISGLVLFQSGQMLWQLSEQEAAHLDEFRSDSVLKDGVSGDSPQPVSQDELIFAKSGSIAGRITDIAGNVMVIRDRSGQLQKMPLETVTYVRSPRVYIFTISGQPSADRSHTRVDSINFRPTANLIMLGDQVMVGKPRDMFDDLDDPLVPSTMPMHKRGFGSDDIGAPPQRPFSAWP